MNHVVVGLVSRSRKDGEREYLLVKSRRDFGEYTGCWYPPGGHVEEGEDEEVALMREIEEELGMNVKPVEKMIETPGDVKDQMTSWWTCELVSDDRRIQDEEIAEAGWFTREEMEAMSLWPATQEFFEKHVFVQ